MYINKLITQYNLASEELASAIAVENETLIIQLDSEIALLWQNILDCSCRDSKETLVLLEFLLDQSLPNLDTSTISKQTKSKIIDLFSPD